MGEACFLVVQGAVGSKELKDRMSVLTVCLHLFKDRELSTVGVSGKVFYFLRGARFLTKGVARNGYNLQSLRPKVCVHLN